MENLDQETKNKIKELIEAVLEPIEGEMLEFGNVHVKEVYKMKRGGERTLESKDRECCVDINTKYGNNSTWISYNKLNESVWEAVREACYDLVHHNEIDWEDGREILRRLYSDDFEINID